MATDTEVRKRAAAHQETLRQLGKAAADYQRTERAHAAARADLTMRVQAAHRAGMSKAEIGRVLAGTWSRSWIDTALRGVERGVPGQSPS